MKLQLLPHLLLIAAFVILWLPPLRRLWPVVLIASIGSALWLGVISVSSLAAIVLFAFLCWGWNKLQSSGHVMVRVVLWLLLLSASLALALHLIPGFVPVPLMQNVALSAASSPFSIIFNYDKALVGFLLLAMCATLLVQQRDWTTMLRQLWPIWLATFVIVSGVMIIAGYLRLDPKWHGAFVWWALKNLFFTCMAEETFFRLLIQTPLQQLLGSRRGMAGVAIGISALLFGLVHAASGWPMVIAASLAGIGYGWAFYRTGRIEAAILVHFGVNATHFLLLTYPMAS